MSCAEIVVNVCNCSMDAPAEDGDDYPIKHVTRSHFTFVATLVC